jgi:voltage-gated potassium channel
MEKSYSEKLKQKLYIIIYGHHTFSGKLFDVLLLLAILLNVIVIMLETIQGIDVLYHKEFITIEWILTILFTLEYIFRIIVIDKPKQYIFSFYGIIDLLAILPLYLSLIVSSGTVLSVIKALRLLRLFKIMNTPMFNGQSNHLIQSLVTSRAKIFIFIYFVIICVILIGSVMYVVEGPENGFTSIPTSIYWCIVTLTTVGYGDISPGTPLGQFIASFVMILGYGIIAVPTGIVTAEYVKSDSKNNENRINSNEKLVKICPHCLAKNHSIVANYCYNCGEEL